MKSLFAGLLLMLASQFSLANPLKAGPLTVDGAWARSTAAQAANGAVYLNIDSQQVDRLESVSSDVAAKTQIHQSSMDNGIMRMREMAQGITIPAGKPVHFAPGGLHIMLIDLKAPLKVGERFDVTLTFKHAGKVKVPVEVRDMPADDSTHKTMSMN